MSTPPEPVTAVSYRAGTGDAGEERALYKITPRRPVGQFIGVFFNPMDTITAAAVLTHAANPGTFCCAAALELDTMRGVAERNKRDYQDKAYGHVLIEEVLAMALDPANAMHCPQTMQLVRHIRAALNGRRPQDGES